MDEELFSDRFQLIFSAAFPEYASSETERKFFCLTRMLLTANREMNLTAVTGMEEILIKHYADCAFLAQMLPQNVSLLDVGAGAGFPSLPLAILRPDAVVTALDSTEKRMRFVAQTARELGLDRVKTVTGRAEDLGCSPDFREQYDCVTARAVAQLNLLCELCLPLCRVGGTFFALKGAEGETETEQAQFAINCLGGRIKEIRKFVLPDPDGILAPDARLRCIVSVEKKEGTPAEYPRRYARMRAHPLGQ